ncbi:MAG: hypothetical protein ACYCO9_16455 [Streptosporangiaceae bacterium]
MADVASGRASAGVAFLVSAGIVYEIIAFACSSPQTAEINIQTRASTLMKWVHIGESLGVVLVIVAAIVDRKNRVPIIAGGAVAITSSEVLYQYAKASGLKRPGPGTEGQSQAATGRWGAA